MKASTDGVFFKTHAFRIISVCLEIFVCAQNVFGYVGILSFIFKSTA